MFTLFTKNSRLYKCNDEFRMKGRNKTPNMAFVQKTIKSIGRGRVEL